MKKLAALLLLWPMLAIAGAQTPMSYLPFMRPNVAAAAGVSRYPTNIAGYAASSDWYAPYYNAGTGVWGDCMGHADLTYNTSKPGTLAVGSFNAVGLTNNFLETAAIVSGVQYDIFLLYYFYGTPTGDYNTYLLANTNATLELRVRNVFGGFNYGGPVGISGGAVPGQYWVVLRLVQDNGTFSIFTNNVLCNTGTADAGGFNGFRIGANNSGGSISPMNILEGIYYATNVTDSIASNIYTYFRTNYTSASLPNQ